MDIKEKLLDYNLTEETYEELLNDVDKMKNLQKILLKNVRNFKLLK